MAEPAGDEDVSYDRYLTLAEESDEWLEYHDGVVVVMTAPTPTHARIAARLTTLLALRLEGRPCAPLSAGLKVRVDATNRTLLPDVTVVCGPLEHSRVDANAIVNPRVIVEVLSPSTEDYDQGNKFHHYRRLETLHEIVFVAQDRRFVRLARRAGDLWAFDEIEAEGSFRLQGIDVELSLADLYRDALGEIVPA